jgi:hypothetical protein
VRFFDDIFAGDFGAPTLAGERVVTIDSMDDGYRINVGRPKAADCVASSTFGQKA